MPGPASAYAVLELEPGADRAAIEEAYRRLIKRYHPDRSGGDAARAAEINRHRTGTVGEGTLDFLAGGHVAGSGGMGLSMRWSLPQMTSPQPST